MAWGNPKGSCQNMPGDQFLCRTWQEQVSGLRDAVVQQSQMLQHFLPGPKVAGPGLSRCNEAKWTPGKRFIFMGFLVVSHLLYRVWPRARVDDGTQAEAGHGGRKRLRLAAVFPTTGAWKQKINVYKWVPLGNVYIVYTTMESHHFSRENSLFLWPCSTSTAMLNHKRAYNEHHASLNM